MASKKGSTPEQDATDRDRLLPGEDPDTRHLDDADHWLAVYTELLQTKAALLAALNERLAQTEKREAREEVGATDAVLLQRELVRFHERLDFWKGRKAELGASRDRG